MILSLDQLEQRPAELRIDNSIVEQSIARTLVRDEIDVGHDAFGGPRSYLLGACSVCNGQRQRVDLGAPAGVFDIDQAESWSVGEPRQADTPAGGGIGLRAARGDCEHPGAQRRRRRRARGAELLDQVKLRHASPPSPPAS